MLLLLGFTMAGLVLSGFAPADRLTWFLEVSPVIIGVLVLLATRAKIRATPLLLGLLFVHAAVLMAGGHYTYAKVPLGFWIQDLFGMDRNPYDRLGHLAQGFVPAVLVREIFRRKSILPAGPWLFFVVCSVCLAFSACYELIEWASALLLGQSADAFLGTQGDPWDTQWDMFMALLGSLAAQWLLAALHERQLRRLPDDPAR